MTEKERKIKLLELELEKSNAEREREDEEITDLPTDYRKQEVVEDPDRTGSLEAGARGSALGLTYGTAPHILEATGIEEDSVAAFRKAQKDRPDSFAAGDYGTSGLQALLTGGGSIPFTIAGKLAGKAGAKKIGAKITQAVAPKTVKGQTALGAIEGTVEGAARSQYDDAEGVGIDAGISGGISTAAPGAFKAAGWGVGKVAQGINAMMPRPGRSGPISDKLSDMASSSAEAMGTAPDTAKAYNQLMKDEGRLDLAMKAGAEFKENFPVYRQKAIDFNDKVKQVSSDKYDDMSGTAFQKLGDSEETLETVRKEAISSVQGHIEDTTMGPGRGLFTKRTKKHLRNAKTILAGNDPEIRKLLKEIEDTIESGDPAGDLGNLINDFNYELGKTVAQAKREISDGIEWASKKKRSRDEIVLRKAFGELRDITHNPANPGGKEMEAADKFWTSYKTHGEPMIENLKGTDPDGLSTYNVSDWALDKGGKTQEKREALRSAMKKFLKDNFKAGDKISMDTLAEFEQFFQPIRDHVNIGRLSVKTGKSGLGIIAGGAVAASTADLGLGALVTAVLSPATNPATYLTSVHKLRELIKDMGEPQARTLLGKMYNRVKAVIRISGTKAARQNPDSLLEKGGELWDENIQPQIDRYAN